MGWVKVGKYSSYNEDAVKHKTLDELYTMFPLKRKEVIKALHDELRKLGLTRKPKKTVNKDDD
jgi:hypothetical protein